MVKFDYQEYPQTAQKWNQMMIPKIDTTTRDSMSWVEGSVIYNTTIGGLEYYDGTQWLPLLSEFSDPSYDAIVYSDINTVKKYIRTHTTGEYVEVIRKSGVPNSTPDHEKQAFPNHDNVMYDWLGKVIPDSYHRYTFWNTDQLGITTGHDKKQFLFGTHNFTINGLRKSPSGSFNTLEYYYKCYAFQFGIYNPLNTSEEFHVYFDLKYSGTTYHTIHVSLKYDTSTNKYTGFLHDYLGGATWVTFTSYSPILPISIYLGTIYWHSAKFGKYWTYTNTDNSHSNYWEDITVRTSGSVCALVLPLTIQLMGSYTYNNGFFRVGWIY